MAFSLAHTIDVDTTDGSTTAASNWAALDYLFRTFIPARTDCETTFVTDTSSTKKVTFRIPMRNTMDSNAVVHSHWRVNWTPTSTTPSESITLYEDATYTSVPGDSGTDATNAITWYIHSASSAWGALDWKFWTSDVDDSVWLVTRGDQAILSSLNPSLMIPDPYNPAPGTDRSIAQISPAMQGRPYWLNMPIVSNIISTEYAAYIFRLSNVQLPENEILATNWIISQTTSAVSTTATVTCSDLKMYQPARSARSSTMAAMSMSTASITVWLVNGVDYYLMHGIPGSNSTTFGYYMGTTEPDIST